MSVSKDPIAGAIMASNVAWSALLAVLASQGAVDVHTVYSELVRMQQRYLEAGNDSIADALDWHIDVTEGIQSDR